MALVPKEVSKLADTNQVPQIGDRQPAVAAVAVSTGIANNADETDLVVLKSEYDTAVAAINSALAALRYHGLIKE